MIRVRTLGPIEVTAAGGTPAPPEIRQRKNLALLVYLARSPNRSRTRDHLTALLWGEKPDAKARHSLREAARILRLVLGDGGLESDSDHLRLLEGAVRLDTEELDDLESSGNWQAAADLIRGEFLEGLAVKEAWAFDEWLAAERLHWTAACIRALANLAEETLAAGRSAEAVGLADRARALDPTSGQAVAVTMRAHMLAGDRGGALAAEEAYRSAITTAGLEPDPELDRVATRVRDEKEWRLGPSVPTASDVGAELRRAPLMGRESELTTLVGMWRESVGGVAVAAVIEGDVGYGKTRLAEELIARARLDSATVASVRCVRGDIEHAGSGIIGLARNGMIDGPGIATASPGALAAFATEIPEWADRFGRLDGTDLTLDAALVEVTRALAAEQPVLLFLDDAHWCDGETLRGLIKLLRDLESLPVLLCLTVGAASPRPELDDLRSRFGRDIRGAAVLLDILDDDALVQLARWAVPDYSADQVERLARRIGSDSAGLPLLAVELLHAVALGLDLEEMAGAWPEPLRTLSQTMPGDLPDTIVAAIRVGFRRLTVQAQQALASAAVLDDRVPPATIARATGLAADELDSALDELEWQRWLAADARGYSFVARIVREVVAQDMVTEGQKLRIREAAGD